MYRNIFIYATKDILRTFGLAVSIRHLNHRKD